MFLSNCKPYKVTVTLFDVAIERRTDVTYLQDVLITISGPLYNFIFALLFTFVYKPLAVSNLLIGLFNLLPVATFDGGQLIKLMLTRRLCDKTTDIILNILSFIFFVPMFCLGLLFLFKSKYNYSLLLISLYLISVLFVK